MLLVIVGALAMLFRYGPDRQPPQWRWVTWGGAVGAILWMILSLGFSWYVVSFGSYNKTYGFAGCHDWVHDLALASRRPCFYWCAQLNAEMETQTAADTTTGSPRPLGDRGAEAADTVA